MQANPPIANAPPPASMPRYPAPVLRAGASRHVVVVAGPPDAAMREFLASLSGVAAERQTVLAFAAATQDDVQVVRLALEQALAQAEAGAQLYLLGPEALIWSLFNLARSMGLQPEEISLLRAESAARPVYCVHCAGLQQAGPGPETDCPHCGVRLLVREHFSQRLGAYMGVCANAQQPYAKEAA